MTETLEAPIILKHSDEMRSIYEPSTDRCWIELPERFLGIAFTAMADNAAIIHDGSWFLPASWIIEEKPELRELVEGIRQHGRNAA